MSRKKNGRLVLVFSLRLQHLDKQGWCHRKEALHEL